MLEQLLVSLSQKSLALLDSLLVERPCLGGVGSR